MTQIDEFYMYENRVDGFTDADCQRAQPYVEAAQAFAYIIVVKKFFMLWFCSCFSDAREVPIINHWKK